ncbi:MAG: DUF1566 domain-containing protein [Gammaproteobacteria bacterium]|nr:DUF1566 domain-containing protein [Gammaproteobacteria bacterium]
MKHIWNLFSSVKHFFLVSIIIITAACGGSGGGGGPTGNGDDPGNGGPTPPTASATLNLQVISNNGESLADVTAQIGSKSYGTTDKNGHVSLAGLSPDSSVAIQLNKSGYANQILKLPTPGGDRTSDFNVTMITRQAQITFNTDVPETVIGEFGAKVVLNGDDFVDSDGNPVSGDVQVAVTPLDVSTPAGLASFPGSFEATDQDGEDQQLITYGTTEFHFTQGEEELQLAEGKKVAIELPIFFDTHPDGKPVARGDKIPLWYLNEETGIWIQEGVGTVITSATSKTGFALSGEVSHFTWWNVDIPVTSLSSAAVLVTLSDPSIDTSEAIARVYGSTAGSRTGYIEQAVGVRGEPVRFAADIGICFKAEITFINGNLRGQRVTSDKVCYDNGLPVTGSPHPVDIVVDIGTFTLNASVPTSATVASNIRACGQPSRVVPNQYKPPVTYSIVSGSLPDGLVLNLNNGEITGSPTVSGPSGDIVIRGVDALKRVADTAPFSIDVSPQLTISINDVVPLLTVDSPFDSSGFVTLSGGRGPLNVRQYANSALPPGIGFSDTTYEISGTPGTSFRGEEREGYYGRTLRLEAVDANCATARVDHVIEVNDPPILAGSVGDLEIDQPISFTASNSGGAVAQWSLIGAPAWLTINVDTGALVGTPAYSDLGTVNATIRAENNIGHPNGPGFDELQIIFNVVTTPPLLNEAQDVNVKVDDIFSIQPTNTGGPAAEWAINIALPTGLNFNTNTGELSGSQGSVGTISGIEITATNFAGTSNIYGPFNINVASNLALPVIGGTPVNGQVDALYSFIPSNSGGLADSWALIGSLPSGLSFNTTTGEISGTPTEADVFAGLSITATNGTGTSDPHVVSITVDKGTQTIAFSQFDKAEMVRSSTGDPGNAIIDGVGIGAILYDSSVPAVATVDPDTGVITIVADGSSPQTTRITATKAAGPNYLSATTYFELTIDNSSTGVQISRTNFEQSVNSTPIATFELPIEVVSGDVTSWSATGLPDYLTMDADGFIRGYNLTDVHQFDGDINVIATGTSSSHDVTFRLTLRAAAPEFQNNIPGGRIVLDSKSWDAIFTPVLINSGGYATNWQVTSDNYPGPINELVQVISNLYDDGDSYFAETNLEIYHGNAQAGIWNVEVTASNMGGTNTAKLSFEIEIRPKLKFELKAKPGELVVVLNTNTFQEVSGSNYTLYVSDDPAYGPDNTGVPGETLVNYQLGTAINLVDSKSIDAFNRYYMTMVVTYPGGESRFGQMYVDIETMQDTGLTYCWNGSAMDYDCYTNDIVTGYPLQDGAVGSSGRSYPDYYTIKKFTHIDAAGTETPDSSTCVRDEITGLLWQRSALTGVIQTGINDAITGLNGSSSCGRTDWRLPTVNELQGILDYGRKNSFAEFSTPSAGYLYTSDVVDPTVSPLKNWSIQPYAGAARWYDITASAANAILVSGTSTPAAMEDLTNGTIRDNSTGLIWKKCPEGYIFNKDIVDPANQCELNDLDVTTFSWANAILRAKAVSNGDVGENLGMSGWRVPNIRELDSILNRSDAAGINGMIDRTLFPLSSGSISYWSSSYLGGTTTGLYINIDDGGDQASNSLTLGSTYAQRLVRYPDNAVNMNKRRWYRDQDGDGYVNRNDFMDAIEQPAGYYPENYSADCDDSITGGAINPGATELLDDDIDNNCNGMVNETNPQGDPNIG